MQDATQREAAVRGLSVLITGASRGIGAATARRFAAACRAEEALRLTLQSLRV